MTRPRRTRFTTYLARKYRDHPIDVIIAMDLTTRFLLEQGRDLFVGVPIVHTVAVGKHPAAESSDPRLVGIRGVFDARSTVQTALRLHPGTRRWSSSAPPPTAGTFSASRSAASSRIFEGRVKVDVPDRSVARRAALPGRHLDRRAIVLFVVFYDPRGARLTGALLRATSPPRWRASPGARCTACSARTSTRA